MHRCGWGSWNYWMEDAAPCYFRWKETADSDWRCWLRNTAASRATQRKVAVTWVDKCRTNGLKNRRQRRILAWRGFWLAEWGSAASLRKVNWWQCLVLCRNISFWNDQPGNKSPGEQIAIRGEYLDSLCTNCKYKEWNDLFRLKLKC